MTVCAAAAAAAEAAQLCVPTLACFPERPLAMAVALALPMYLLCEYMAAW
jgi:hypothetical protein